MLKLKGTINKEGEVVFQYGKPLPLQTLFQHETEKNQVEICIEIFHIIGLDRLISGINGFVWVTKESCQAEIITNALQIQNIESEIVNTDSNNTKIYMIKVIREEDIKQAVDFLQNDNSGLRLKPDWNYPAGERNESFEQWLNE